MLSTTTQSAHPIDTSRCDPLTTVFGAESATYSCPDLAAVDAHLVRLCQRIELAAPRFPALVTLFRGEIDRLLDRRCWLEMVSRTATPV
ncbi:hypothetical protein [Actinomycetospora flava]|uniref:Uncharacterized protein n=1 Tax=Actinomycetospora flava TaxID=3129232 RepID=A0ABU8MEL2_9PSEU